MSGYTVWLHSGEGTSADRIGGKGASLARLSAAGFPVPPGFGVAVDAYRAFHGSLSLDEAMEPLLNEIGQPTLMQIREACAPLLARLDGAELAVDLADAIRVSFARLEMQAGQGRPSRRSAARRLRRQARAGRSCPRGDREAGHSTRPRGNAGADRRAAPHSHRDSNPRRG